MKPEELQQAIRFEAPKYIPGAVEDVALSWDVVSGMESKTSVTPEKRMLGKIEVLLVAALKQGSGEVRTVREEAGSD